MTKNEAKAQVKKGSWSKKYEISNKGVTTTKKAYREKDGDETDLEYKVDCWLNAVNQPKTKNEDPLINNENMIRAIVNAILTIFKGETNEGLEWMKSRDGIITEEMFD